MKILLPSLSVCSTFLILSSAIAQASPSDNSLTSSPVFEKNCAGCHGKSAEGRHFAGPSLKSDKVSAASDSDLRNMITNGKGRMPKFSGKLSVEEIDTLLQQIRALNKK
ncbi:MAG TPA: cytochrome c [Verrucomicrobiae bacterium]|nr:cytochrome c [Verrucomicrobiae bacterium]